MEPVRAGFVLLIAMMGLAGCSGSSSPSPIMPTPVPTSTPRPGSVTLSGAVYDTAFRPLEGARVEVVNGPDAGMSTTAQTYGTFTLFGVFDAATRFRATHEGHIESERTWIQCATCSRPWLGFTLAVPVPPVNLAGDYSLTFAANGACPGFPDDLRTRVYSTVISPASDSTTTFQATVTGAVLFGKYRTFDLNVAGNDVTVWLGDLHGDPGIVEELATPVGVKGQGYLAFAGAASASATNPARIEAAMDGAFDYCAHNATPSPFFSCSGPGAVAFARCVSTDHRLILTRH
jgi:hypothetical protein